jgi:hypothetical protein
MKTLHKPNSNATQLKTLVNKVPNGTSWTALELETQADAERVTKEIKAFIGKELKPVTVLLVKGL